MTETSRNIELQFIFRSQFYPEPFSESWRIFPQINGYIKNFPFKTRNQFRLCMFAFLQMNTSQNSVRRFRNIILHKMAIHSGKFFEFLLIEFFVEISSFIFEDGGFDDVTVFEWGGFDFHL